MNQNFKSLNLFKEFLKIAIILSLAVPAFVLFAAWQEPSASPTGSNVDAPINIGGAYQEKAGNLWVNSFGVTSGLVVQSGRVGIGTVSPTAELEVANSGDGIADIRLSRSGGSTWGIYRYGSAQSDRFNIGIVGVSEPFTITTAGNIGIGTASPGHKLEVSGGNIALDFSDANNSRYIGQEGSGGAFGANQGAAGMEIENINAPAPDSQLHFWTQKQGVFSGRTMTIDTVGNVGIGTTGPLQKLHVTGYIRGDSGLCIGSDCRTSWGAVTGLQGGGTVNYIGKFTGTGTIGNSQIFDNGTNIGIGTASPAYKVDIYGNNLRIARDGDSTSALYLDRDGSSSQWGVYRYGSAGSDRFCIGITGASEPFCISTSGNVGIGTASPGAKLEVAGQIKITGGTPGNNKVLTSNASGLATWESLPASGDDGIPTGAVMYFNLASCPNSWSEFTQARGLYIVGLPLGGSLGSATGTALTNLENRPVGAHEHQLAGHYFSYGGGNRSEWVPAGGGAIGDTDGLIGLTAVAGTNAPYIQLRVCQKN